LDERLAPPPGSQFDQITHGINNEWEIGDCLAQWWRPNFETFMVIFFRSIYLSFFISFDLVSFHSSAYYEAERVQKALRCSDARKKYVFSFSNDQIPTTPTYYRSVGCPKKYETPCNPSF
jgi:hypothetical protein